MISNYKKIILNKFNEWIPRSWKTWITIAFAVILVIGHTGFWVMPNISAQFMVSQSLTSNPFPNPDGQYIFTNYFQPLIFGIFGGTNLSAYVIYASIISLCFFILFLLWFIKFHGEKTAIDEQKILLAILFPVFLVSFYWIGMDGMTLLLMLIIMINFSSKWVILPAILLAFQHFEQGFVAVMILLGTLITYVIFTHDKTKFNAFKKVFYILGGIIIGKILLFLLFHFFYIDMSGNRWTSIIDNINSFINQWKVGWPYVLFSLFGVCWFLIFMKIKKLWPLVVGGIFTFFFLLIVGDQTRVGTIVLFPSLFFWIFMDKEIWSSLNKKIIIFIVAIYLILPVVFVWGGFPFKGLRTYDITEIKTILKYGLDNYEVDTLKPFLTSKAPLFKMTYLASDLPSQVGTVISYKREAVKTKDPAGFLSFGPYVDLTPGTYKITINYSSLSGVNQIIGWSDVFINKENKTFSHQMLYGTSGIEKSIDLLVEIKKQVKGLETRVWFNGLSQISLSNIIIQENPI